MAIHTALFEGNGCRITYHATSVFFPNSNERSFSILGQKFERFAFEIVKFAICAPGKRRIAVQTRIQPRRRFLQFPTNIHRKSSGNGILSGVSSKLWIIPYRRPLILERFLWNNMSAPSASKHQSCALSPTPSASSVDRGSNIHPPHTARESLRYIAKRELLD
jgi:hypothetical protein